MLRVDVSGLRGNLKMKQAHFDRHPNSRKLHALYSAQTRSIMITMLSKLSLAGSAGRGETFFDH